MAVVDYLDRLRGMEHGPVHELVAATNELFKTRVTRTVKNGCLPNELHGELQHDTCRLLSAAKLDHHRIGNRSYNPLLPSTVN